MVKFSKTVFAILVVVFTMTLGLQKTQAQVKLGLKGGLNLTQLSLDEEIIDSKNRNGFFIGPTLKVTLPIALGFDISALYDQREMELEEQKVKQEMVSVPVNLRLRIGEESSLSAFVFAGPQFDFHIGGKNKLIDEAKEWKFKQSNFSANFGVGVVLIKNLQITASYNVVLGKTADVSENTWQDSVEGLRTHDAKTNAWQVSMAVFF